jgi:hypothetical protein
MFCNGRHTADAPVELDTLARHIKVAIGVVHYDGRAHQRGIIEGHFIERFLASITHLLHLRYIQRHQDLLHFLSHRTTISLDQIFY